MRALLTAGSVGPVAIELWLPSLTAAADRFEINTRLRQVHWLATMVHESTRFMRLEENLNYSAHGLLQTWPSRFTAAEAVQYAHDPQHIANRVYANRGGNGDEASGEGWFYRGRGPIQTTFRDNYRAASAPCSVDLLPHPELLLLPQYGSIASAFFWHTHHLNTWADADDIVAIRRRVNGGTIGLEEVRLLVDRMKLA